jgi:hypothetical protein
MRRTIVASATSAYRFRIVFILQFCSGSSRSGLLRDVQDRNRERARRFLR